MVKIADIVEVSNYNRENLLKAISDDKMYVDGKKSEKTCALRDTNSSEKHTYFARNVFYAIFLPVLILGIAACFAFPPVVPGIMMLAAIGFAFGGMICEVIGGMQHAHARSLKQGIDKLEEKSKVLAHNQKLLEKVESVSVVSQEEQEKNKAILANIIKLESTLVSFFASIHVDAGSLGKFRFHDSELEKLVLEELVKQNFDKEKLKDSSKLKEIAEQLYKNIHAKLTNDNLSSSYLHPESKDALSGDAKIKITDADMKKLHRMLDKQLLDVNSISR